MVDDDIPGIEVRGIPRSSGVEKTNTRDGWWSWVYLRWVVLESPEIDRAGPYLRLTGLGLTWDGRCWGYLGG
jgi:hypothetical protein